MRIIFNTLCSAFPFLSAWFASRFFGEYPPFLIIALWGFYGALLIYFIAFNYREDEFWSVFALINFIFMLIFMKIWFVRGFALEYSEQLLSFIITYPVAVISGFSALLFTFGAITANASNYALRKKYGIPFRLAASFVKDTYDILVEIFIVCLAVLFPMFYVFGGLNDFLYQRFEETEFEYLTWIILVITLNIGILYTLPYRYIRGYARAFVLKIKPQKPKIITGDFLERFTKKENSGGSFFGKPKKLWDFLKKKLNKSQEAQEVIIYFIFHALILIITLSFFTKGGMFSLFAFLWLMLPLGKLFFNICLKIIGEFDVLFTFSKEDKQYLAVLPYVKEVWVCVPCKTDREYDESLNKKGNITFNKGELFIEKTGDMSHIKTRESSEYFFNVKKEKD